MVRREAYEMSTLLFDLPSSFARAILTQHPTLAASFNHDSPTASPSDNVQTFR